jgi:hypothetical protein
MADRGWVLAGAVAASAVVLRPGHGGAAARVDEAGLRSVARSAPGRAGRAGPPGVARRGTGSPAAFAIRVPPCVG